MHDLSFDLFLPWILLLTPLLAFCLFGASLHGSLVLYLGVISQWATVLPLPVSDRRLPFFAEHSLLFPAADQVVLATALLLAFSSVPYLGIVLAALAVVYALFFTAAPTSALAAEEDASEPEKESVEVAQLLSESERDEEVLRPEATTLQEPTPQDTVAQEESGETKKAYQIPARRALSISSSTLPTKQRSDPIARRAVSTVSDITTAGEMTQEVSDAPAPIVGSTATSAAAAALTRAANGRPNLQVPRAKLEESQLRIKEAIFASTRKQQELFEQRQKSQSKQAPPLRAASVTSTLPPSHSGPLLAARRASALPPRINTQSTVLPSRALSSVLDEGPASAPLARSHAASFDARGTHVASPPLSPYLSGSSSDSHRDSTSSGEMHSHEEERKAQTLPRTMQWPPADFSVMLSSRSQSVLLPPSPISPRPALPEMEKKQAVLAPHPSPSAPVGRAGSKVMRPPPGLTPSDPSAARQPSRLRAVSSASSTSSVPTGDHTSSANRSGVSYRAALLNQEPPPPLATETAELEAHLWTPMSSPSGLPPAPGSHAPWRHHPEKTFEEGQEGAQWRPKEAPGMIRSASLQNFPSFQSQPQSGSDVSVSLSSSPSLQPLRSPSSVTSNTTWSSPMFTHRQTPSALHMDFLPSQQGVELDTGSDAPSRSSVSHDQSTHDMVAALWDMPNEVFEQRRRPAKAAPVADVAW